MNADLMATINWVYFTALAAFALLFAFGWWHETRAERKRVDAEAAAGVADLETWLQEMSQP